MTDLFALQNALAAAMNADPVLRLAHLTAWLDPLWREDDDWDMPQDEDDTLYVALRLLRGAFPDIYFDALMAMRGGTTYPQLDHLICGAVQAQGIPLESLEWMAYGIPLPAYGVDLYSADFYAAHPDAVPVLACFGVSSEPNPYDIRIPDAVYDAANCIADSLATQADAHWQQVAWTIRFLFSLTGNSSVDWDDEMMYSVDPLGWNPADIAFACDIIKEADTIMADALAGLAFLKTHPAALNVLQDNVRRVYKAIERQKSRQTEPKVRLKWHDYSS